MRSIQILKTKTVRFINYETAPVLTMESSTDINICHCIPNKRKMAEKSTTKTSTYTMFKV